MRRKEAKDKFDRRCVVANRNLINGIRNEHRIRLPVWDSKRVLDKHVGEQYIHR